MIPYLNICIRITIAEKYVLHNVESIEINNSLDNLSDTAKVKIPKYTTLKFDKAKAPEKVNVIDIIKLDDKIKIEAGYDDNYNTEFEGYITNITDDIPIILDCTDEMHKLKTAERINATFKNADIKDILRKIAPKYQVETFKEFKIGKFAINNETPYEVLMNLKNISVRTYFKDGVLHAGLPINLQGYKVHQFNMNRNVRQGNDLKYEHNKKNYYLKVISNEVGTSKPIFYEIGTKGDNNKEIHLPVGMSKKDLENYAKDFHKGISETKCYGSFKSWGLPQTKAGDTADITTPNFPDSSRNGKYIIQSVMITLNKSDGFQRKNNLGVQLYK